MLATTRVITLSVMRSCVLFALIAPIIVHISIAISMHSLFRLNRFTQARTTLRGGVANSSSAIGCDKPNVIFVLGGPGAGKGTQCEKIAKEFNIKHLSAGELLRQEQMRPTENGRLIDAFLKEGKIVPVEISLGLLKKEIVDLKWNRYLIDGFPRNWDNLDGWNRCMSDTCNVESILFIDCQQKELEKRIMSRGVSSGRDDDNLESLKKRFATFKRETMPVVNYFKTNMSNKFVAINGDQPVEKVYQDMVVPVKAAITREIEELTKKEVNGQIRHEDVLEYSDIRAVEFRKNRVYISYRFECTDKDGWMKIEFEELKWTFKDGKWSKSRYLGDWPPLPDEDTPPIL